MERHLNFQLCIHNAQIPGYDIGAHDCGGLYSIDEMHEAFRKEGYRPLGKRESFDITDEMAYMKAYSPDSIIYIKDNKSYGIVGFVNGHACWHVWTF